MITEGSISNSAVKDIHALIAGQPAEKFTHGQLVGMLRAIVAKLGTVESLKPSRIENTARPRPLGAEVSAIMRQQRAAKAAQTSKPSAAAPSAAAPVTKRDQSAELDRLRAETATLRAKLAAATKPAAITTAKPSPKPAKPDPVAEYLAAVESGDKAKRQAIFAKHKWAIRNHYRRVTPGA